MSNAHFGAFIGVDGKQPLCSNATAGETQLQWLISIWVMPLLKLLCLITINNDRCIPPKDSTLTTLVTLIHGKWHLSGSSTSCQGAGLLGLSDIVLSAAISGWTNVSSKVSQAAVFFCCLRV